MPAVQFVSRIIYVVSIGLEIKCKYEELEGIKLFKKV